MTTNNVETLPTTPKPQTTREVIQANVDLLIEQLEAGHSEALTAYLTAMGRFHNYSLGNILEIARQKPDATRVAGMYAWNQLGRRVKEGEKGIRIPRENEPDFLAEADAVFAAIAVPERKSNTQKVTKPTLVLAKKKKSAAKKKAAA